MRYHTIIVLEMKLVGHSTPNNTSISVARVQLASDFVSTQIYLDKRLFHVTRSTAQTIT